jgi:hypothetical protein
MSENNKAPNEFSHLIDAYTPAKIAAFIEGAGVRKVHLPLIQIIALGFMAGAFIAFGAVFFTVTVTDSGLGLGRKRLLGGIVFSLGPILGVIGGAGLFTGNNLIAMAWAEKKVTMAETLRNGTLALWGQFDWRSGRDCPFGRNHECVRGRPGRNRECDRHGQGQFKFHGGFLQGDSV